MRKPRHQPKQFDPDALDFYVWDHLNVDERFKRLELISFSRRRFNASGNYYRDVQLARGYRHPRLKRPANFCRISVSGDPNPFQSVHVTFEMGWLRRTSSVYKIKHALIGAPNGAFSTHYSFDNHAVLAEFEDELTQLISALSTHEFTDISDLYMFMQNWKNGGYRENRVKSAFVELEKAKQKEPAPPTRATKLTRHRMGRPLVRHGSISYRGR